MVRLTFAPTGKYQDALDVSNIIAGLWSDQDSLANYLDMATAWLGRQQEDGADRVGVSWGQATRAPDSVAIHVDDMICGQVETMAESVPRPTLVSDMGLPMAGIAQFAAPIAAPANTGSLRVVAVTWTHCEIADVGMEIIVTPWARAIDVDGIADGTVFPGRASVLHDSGPLSDRNSPWDSVGNHFPRILVSLAGWMGGVIRVERRPAPRAVARRRVDDRMPSVVSVLRLRRLESIDTGPTDEHGVEYTHRWIVRQHWRQQPCGPGGCRRKPILVGPYIKGPADKPLVAKDRIWNVDR